MRPHKGVFLKLICWKLKNRFYLGLFNYFVIHWWWLLMHFSNVQHVVGWFKWPVRLQCDKRGENCARTTRRLMLAVRKTTTCEWMGMYSHTYCFNFLYCDLLLWNELSLLNTHILCNNNRKLLQRKTLFHFYIFLIIIIIIFFLVI